jgi:hypothetical protein
LSQAQGVEENFSDLSSLLRLTSCALYVCAAVELSSNERQQHVFPHPAAVAFMQAKVQLAAQAIGIIF